jgi:hypothetical protein
MIMGNEKSIFEMLRMVASILYLALVMLMDIVWRSLLFMSFMVIFISNTPSKAGNPFKYDQNDINPISQSSYGELYTKTLERDKLIISLGYHLSFYLYKRVELL